MARRANPLNLVSSTAATYITRYTTRTLYSSDMLGPSTRALDTMLGDVSLPFSV